MNLVQMICCALIAKASEFGISNKVQTINVRRVQTIDDANRLIDSATQELKIASSDLCKCATPATEATEPTQATVATHTTEGRRMFWKNNAKK
jgi:hypothetical protein